MNKTPEEKAKELFDQYHNLIQEIGGDMGHEILVSILAKHCTLIAVDELIKSHYLLTTTHDIKPSIRCKSYWQEVERKINNL
jgi:hypothetical protein